VQITRHKLNSSENLGFFPGTTLPSHGECALCGWVWTRKPWQEWGWTLKLWWFKIEL